MKWSSMYQKKSGNELIDNRIISLNYFTDSMKYYLLYPTQAINLHNLFNFAKKLKLCTEHTHAENCVRNTSDKQ